MLRTWLPKGLSNSCIISSCSENWPASCLSDTEVSCPGCLGAGWKWLCWRTWWGYFIARLLSHKPDNVYTLHGNSPRNIVECRSIWKAKINTSFSTHALVNEVKTVIITNLYTSVTYVSQDRSFIRIQWKMLKYRNQSTESMSLLATLRI